MRQIFIRTGATALAAALVALSGGPAAAAEPIARATASGLVVTVGGSPTDSGTYRVTNDGSGESASGSNSPTLSALSGQSLISAGTLAQDATTSVRNAGGFSAACAGLAGDGATLVAVGEGGCLAPGENVSLQAGSLDFSTLQIVDSTVLMGLDQQLQDALDPVLAPVVAALSGALQDGLGQLGDPGLFVDLGAVQSTCRATPDSATGDATLAGAGAYAQIGDTRVDLVSLPVHPAPNTHVVTDLDGVAVALEDALKSQLSTALDGALGAAAAGIDQAAVINNVLAQLGDQLAPLEENVLDGILNKQSRPSEGAIAVTALDLSVLPAARQFGVEALHVEIGAVTCGANGRLRAPQALPAPTQPAGPAAVPTSVPAGLASAHPRDPSGGGSPLGNAALGAVLVLAAGAGVASYRRSLSR